MATTIRRSTSFAINPPSGDRGTGSHNAQALPFLRSLRTHSTASFLGLRASVSFLSAATQSPTTAANAHNGTRSPRAGSPSTVNSIGSSSSAMMRSQLSTRTIVLVHCTSAHRGQTSTKRPGNLRRFSYTRTPHHSTALRPLTGDASASPPLLCLLRCADRSHLPCNPRSDDMETGALAVEHRAYDRARLEHRHDYRQVVFPEQGRLGLMVEEQT